MRLRNKIQNNKQFTLMRAFYVLHFGSVLDSVKNMLKAILLLRVNKGMISQIHKRFYR